MTKEIRQHAPYLIETGQVVSVTIATDGEASDGDIYAALQSLINLPVMVVVRLCTNESRVVNYWNNIEKNLEIRLDVIDDLLGEAEEVTKVNGWLTYGEPLQRMREFGVTMKELDILDEETLSWENFLRVTALIYGPEMVAQLPPVEEDWDEFFEAFARQVQGIVGRSSTHGEEKEIVCPLRYEKKSWISLSETQRIYAPKIASSKQSKVFSGSSLSAWNVVKGSGKELVVYLMILLILAAAVMIFLCPTQLQEGINSVSIYLLSHDYAVNDIRGIGSVQ